MRTPLCSLALLSLTSCDEAVLETVRASERDEQVTPVSAELRESCASTLSDVELARDIGSAGSAEVTIESHARGLSDCADFAWARALVRGSALVSPSWAGPSLSTAWDCNHSSLEYAVYRWGASGWQYVNGALAFGALSSEGVCGYSVDNAPRQSGSDETIVLGGRARAAELRVGLRAWSHNDTAMGHPGGDCAAPSCYWPVRLRLRGY